MGSTTFTSTTLLARRFSTVPGERMSAKTRCSSSQTAVVPLGDRLGVPSGQTVATNPSRCSLITRFLSSVRIRLRCGVACSSVPPSPHRPALLPRLATLCLPNRRRRSGELAAQAVHVAENPCLGQAAIPGREECCSVVGHEDAGGWYAEDLTAVVARVTQPGGGAVALGDQVEDLVAEIGERGADLVAVAAELVLAGGFVAQRAPEDEALVEQVGDGRVIPQVPYVRVEALNQISHLASLPVSRNPRLLLSRPLAPAWPFHSGVPGTGMLAGVM